MEVDFEQGSAGSLAKGADGFTDPFKTVYSTAHAISGTQSGEASINAGSEGFGDWGGQINTPDLFEGDEIWLRVFLFYPNGFDFACSSCIGVKTLRIHTASSSGGNEGYFDMLTYNTGLTAASEITPEFFDNNPEAKWNDIGAPVTTGRWHAYEMYVKFSSQPGQGIFRLWQNGNLIFEDTQTRTMRTSSSKSDFIYFWSYWNGRAPATQKAYIDHVIITNETPATRDKHGNPFIGLGNITLLSPPKPPTIRQ